jgi:nucleoside 2-deoxyribosyltransferase
MLSPATDSPLQTMRRQEAGQPDERPSRGRIYLAGPFTSHLTFPASGPDAANSDALRQGGGVIDPQSAWRRTLQATTEALEAIGWTVFLPHRDVSWWGERDVSPGVVARECLEAVVASDVVVAVMGESFGTHVEVGAAIARGIPVVAVRCAATSESFFALAVAQSPWVGVLSVPTLSDMPKTIATAAFLEALHQARASRLGEGDAVPSSPSAALR